MMTNRSKSIVIVVLFLLGYCSSVYAQCYKGQQNRVNKAGEMKRDANFCAEGNSECYQPVDPNEIIGLEGYNAPESTDTLRWASATQSLAYIIYFENDAELAMAAARKIPLAHCVRGGMVRFADGRVGKRRAASENVPLPVTSSSPPFFFLFCLQVRNAIPRNVTTLSGISSVWQQTSKKCSLT